MTTNRNGNYAARDIRPGDVIADTTGAMHVVSRTDATGDIGVMVTMHTTRIVSVPSVVAHGRPVAWRDTTEVVTTARFYAADAYVTVVATYADIPDGHDIRPAVDVAAQNQNFTR